MYKELAKRKNPWLRENLCEEEGELNPDHYTPELMHYITHLSSKRPKFEVKDFFLCTNTKKAVIIYLLSKIGEAVNSRGTPTTFSKSCGYKLLRSFRISATGYLLRRRTIVENTNRLNRTIFWRDH
uniref:Uncharacterized protein LOC105851125 n=1 Tax=Cicer arietinum TaxID=3827 RepID=A0A3Q7YH23_CICAR|nr:uncharacterized protein LOC105851125 [Cicer arietinum]